MAVGAVLARARTDANDRLISADEPLAGLQLRCGGEMPGTVAVPQLLEVVRKARTMGLRLARTIEAFDGEDTVRAWVEIAPSLGDEGEVGCSIAVGAWQTITRHPESEADAAARETEIDRIAAELTARLDPAHKVLAVEARAADLAEYADILRGARETRWFEHVEFPHMAHRQPVHWRLLEGARCTVSGSSRTFTVSIVPLGQPEPGSAGFELLLLSDTPFVRTAPVDPVAEMRTTPSFGRDLTPVLRQPIARIIANAETIRSRLAGPIADEYSNYAADIAAAGQHLLALIEDLSDLEVVEAEDFTTAPDRIDLGDVARRAVGILGVRAREKGIDLVAPPTDRSLAATAEFRRVLQILLNLVGNAIRYAPGGSAVLLAVEAGEGGRPRISVSDQGPGLAPDQLEAVFEKFERLGRTNDGGSGLGLYISRRLARAMGGDLFVASTLGAGATFTLELPPAR